MNLSKILSQQSALILMPCTDLSHSELVQACLTSNEDAWTEFTRRYQQVITLAVLRTARRWGDTSKAVLDDLAADTYFKLCANNFELLRNFRFRTEMAIYGFLKVVATNVAHDYFRQKRAKKRGVELSIEDVYEPPNSANPGGPDEIERNLLMKEVEQILREVTGPDGERDRTIFWLHHRQGFTAIDIAQLEFLDLSTKGVESAIHRITKAVRERLMDKAAACAVAQSKK